MSLLKQMCSHTVQAYSSQKAEEGVGNKPEKRQRTLANFLTAPKTYDPDQDEKEGIEHPSLDAEASSLDNAAEESPWKKEFSEEKENRVQPTEIENDNLGFKITFGTGGFSEPFSGLEFFDTPPKGQSLNQDKATVDFLTTHPNG